MATLLVSTQFLFLFLSVCLWNTCMRGWPMDEICTRKEGKECATQSERERVHSPFSLFLSPLLHSICLCVHFSLSLSLSLLNLYESPASSVNHHLLLSLNRPLAHHRNHANRYTFWQWLSFWYHTCCWIITLKQVRSETNKHTHKEKRERERKRRHVSMCTLVPRWRDKWTVSESTRSPHDKCPFILCTQNAFSFSLSFLLCVTVVLTQIEYAKVNTIRCYNERRGGEKW